MIKSKGILTISIISLFAVESAYASIASSGYVDQQVGTKISEVHATKTGTGNVVSSISAEGNTVTANKDIDAEVTDNKVITIRTDGTATDVAYPSEKAVATALDAKQDKLEGEVLTNTATGENSLSTGGAKPAVADDAFAVGAVASADTASMAIGIGSSASGQGMAVGQKAKALKEVSFAIGQGARSDASYSSAIGTMATASAERAIQIGQGTNSEANTLSVGLDGTNNYKLLGSDGKIPAERLPFEGDVLTNTATGSGSFSTGGAVPVSGEAAAAIGVDATAKTAAIAIGMQAHAEDDSVVLGKGASTSELGGVAIGEAASAGKLGVAVGFETAAAVGAIAIGGSSEASATNAIQLGAGSNSEAGTLSVGLQNGNYKLLGSDGKIPAERLPFEGDVLTNTATGENSVSTGGATPVTENYVVALGSGASNVGGTQTVIIGYNAKAESSAEVAIGASASAAGYESTAVGYQATANNGSGTALGAYASAASSSLALGRDAKTQAIYSIQLGPGTNSEDHTFSVGFGDSDNYKLLGLDGKIPVERLPNGILTNTATGNASFSTGNASPASAGSAVAIGENATVQNAGTAIGYLTSSGGSGVALGARASSNKMGGVSMGAQSAVEGDGGIAVGTGAQSAGESSISIGMGAGALSDYAIQLGHGMNAEANTLSVGLGTGTSNNYKLLGSDGKIPAERLPVARIPVGSETSTSYASIWVE